MKGNDWSVTNVILKLIHVLVQTDHWLKGIYNGLDMATSGLHDEHVKNNEKFS